MAKNYDNIAKMYGGQSDDYDAVAAKIGGRPVEEEKTQNSREKFLLSLPPERRAAAEAYQRGESNKVTLDQERNNSPLLNAYANISGGVVKGASNIGATLLWPIDKIRDMANGNGRRTLTSLVTNKEPKTSNQERRDAIDQFMGDSADTESFAYGGGKLGAEIAGTAGIGSVLAGGVRTIPSVSPYLSKLATALESGGFRLGTPAANTISGKVADAGTRMLAGGVVGGASAGAIDPEYANTGAVLGAALPPSVQIAGKGGNAIASKVRAGAERLMQSAIKPTIQQLKSGDAAIAVNTLLKYGINPNAAGVEKLRNMIESTDDEIANAIAGSSATISPQKVTGALNSVNDRFLKQVSPTADLDAIARVKNDFLAHPLFANSNSGGNIPVQLAQDLKRGTYQVLSKKYGQLGSAETEAQKAIARGLKDEINSAVPGVQELNKVESDLIKTLDVAERRALMELNKNPVGLASLASNKAAFAAFMADKSAAFKAIAARMLNRSTAVPKSIGMLQGPLENPALRSGLLAIETNQ